MKRVSTNELLDRDLGTRSEVNASLADLRLINGAFGGVSTTRALLERVFQRTGNSRLSLLEVAAGSSNVPQRAAAPLRQRGRFLDVAVLDRNPSHLNGARPAVVADALALPFRSNAFDLVSCCLFAHHLGPADLTRFVDDAMRVCRVAVLINDLIRSRLHLAMVYAGLPLFRSRITWHDAPASVRQAYTVSEMYDLVKQSTAARVEMSRHYLCHMGVIAWKR